MVLELRILYNKSLLTIYFAGSIFIVALFDRNKQEISMAYYSEFSRGVQADVFLRSIKI